MSICALTAKPSEATSDEELIATTVTSIFFNLDGIQDHYNQGVAGMGQVTAESGTGIGFSLGTNAKLARLIYAPFSQVDPHITDTIPESFRENLDDSGWVFAPAGACGAGAWAQAIFVTNGQQSFWMDSKSHFLGRRVNDIIDHHRRPPGNPKLTAQENPLIIIS